MQPITSLTRSTTPGGWKSKLNGVFGTGKGFGRGVSCTVAFSCLALVIGEERLDELVRNGLTKVKGGHFDPMQDSYYLLRVLRPA